MARAGARAFVALAGLAALPLVVQAQGYCWGNCPSNAISVCTGIILDGYCVDDPTQEQLDRYKAKNELEKRERERSAKERELKQRLSDVRDRAARELKAAEEKAKVEAIAAQLGKGKDEAAARLAKMNEELKSLRPKPAQRQCTTRTFSQPMSNSGANQGATYDSLMRAIAMRSGANIGGSESVISMTAAGSPTCGQEKVVDPISRPPVGNCLACITEAQAKMFGWVPGSGWPAPKTEYVCKVSVIVVAERCGSGTSKVSSQ